MHTRITDVYGNLDASVQALSHRNLIYIECSLGVGSHLHFFRFLDSLCFTVGI